MKEAKFPVGRVVATPGALAVLQRAGQRPVEFLSRHVAGDWGEVGKEDWAENELSLREGFRRYCQVMEQAFPTLPPDAKFVACSGLYSGFASHLRQK